MRDDLDVLPLIERLRQGSYSRGDIIRAAVLLEGLVTRDAAQKSSAVSTPTSEEVDDG